MRTTPCLRSRRRPPSQQVPAVFGDTGGNNTGGTGGGTITPGHWDTTYSSSGTTSWHYVGYDANYKSIAKSDNHPWPTTGSGDGVQNDNDLDAKMSGTVTATLTWVPTTGMDATSDPPSSSVIVTEYSGASARGGSGVGSADDGWGDKSDGGSYPGSSSGGDGSPASSPGYASSSGTQYEIKDSSSGTVTITSGTMTATTPDNVTPDANGNFTGMGVLVSVGFNVQVPPTKTTVSLPGIDSTNQALTGQGVTAQLNNAPAKISSYAWSSTGGTPIKNWNPDGKAADGTPQQLFPLTDADKKGSDTSTDHSGTAVADLSFYDQSAESVTVKCVLQLMLPKDSRGNAKSGTKPVKFLKPTADWTLQTYPSYLGTPPYSQTPGFVTDYKTVMLANAYWDPVQITNPPGFTGQ